MAVRSVAIGFLASLALISAARPAGAAPAAGTAITNVATATYLDGAGNAQAAVSNLVSVTVAAVSSVSVGSGGNTCGNAVAPFPIGPDMLFGFTIVNTSNVADAYHVSSVTASSGTIKSLAFSSSGAGPTTAVPGNATSPAVPPGGTLMVFVDVGTSAIPPGTETIVDLTVRTTNTATANGVQTVTATACGTAETAPLIGAPAPTQTGPPVKLVDGLPSVAAGSGSVVTYTIAYMNHGGMAAHNVVLADPVPGGIVPQLASATLDGHPLGNAASLAGNTLSVALGTLPPAQPHTIAFNAVVDVSSPGGALVNVAGFTASDAPAASSTPADVVEGLANVVFDGALGGGTPLSGASLTLLPASGVPQPVALLGPAVAPNANDANPFVTGAGGAYGFGLGTNQLGAGRFTLLVSAAGYTSRRFSLTLAPDPGGATYDVTLSAADGAPLALPGSFALTHAASVTLPDAYGIFGNLPLFKPQSIVISKSVDRTQAAAGDRLVYTISVSSAASALGPTTVTDDLPRDVLYAPGTSLVDGKPVAPAVSGNALTWTFPSLSAAQTIQFACVVAPGAATGESLVNVAVATGTLPGVGVGTIGANASATTTVVGGGLSDASVVLGRVFVDTVGDGRFRRGERGVAKARVYLEDGESVLTDADGLFSFPAVRPGMHVLHLDPDSLPPSLRAFGVRDYDDPRSSLRLVHGVFDGGLMSDVLFAVRPR